jgi:hypothetical protein
MPNSGKVFIRPKVTTHTTIGASNGELVALDQGTFVVDDIQITKALYGGYVKLSEESIDMTSPEVLSHLLTTWLAFTQTPPTLQLAQLLKQASARPKL